DNGQITITLTGTNANYTGAVYIKLTKTGISHQDELNGTEALDSDLFAVAYLNSGANTINITVRSSIAAKILGVDKTTTAITLNETDINKCNEEVNAAFGLSGSAIDTNVDTINSSGDESNTLAKQAGQVAAALSGMRNTTATNTFEKVIEQIADVIANNGALNKATSTALATGAIAVQAQAQANKAVTTADIDETHAGSAAAALKIAEDAVTTAGTTATNAQKQALATAQEAYNKAVSANQEATSFAKLATNTVTHFNNLIIPISNITISNNTGVVSFITNDSTLTISATLDNALSTGKKLWGSIDNGETWTDISTTNTDIIWSNDNKTIAWRQTLTADTNSSVQFAITKTLTTTTATPSEIKGDIDGGIASHNYIYDSTAPVFDTSNASTIDISQNENLEATVIYIAVTTDANAVTYKLSGTDADKFSIDKNSGEIKYNAKQPTVSEGTTATHHITITATDAAGNASNKNIVINLENPF
ncbi:hypothetical protein THERMOT_715, partial [Bathymodiolus thermophilus thioautotrophic gill symbiont]|uniref:hypothetical protein n=1 Tax=Bathymodiolus thermophilus thioautotrophic gill symbiont TaxID=2360 RepID=UPI00192B73B7